MKEEFLLDLSRHAMHYLPVYYPMAIVNLIVEGSIETGVSYSTYRKVSVSKSGLDEEMREKYRREREMGEEGTKNTRGVKSATDYGRRMKLAHCKDPW